MPRAATTADVFSAIAEPRRREIVDLLASRGAQPVNAVVAELRLPQPAVSKHLSVLRAVGLVTVTRAGRQRLYRLHAEALKPVHDWTQTFERFWTHQLESIKALAERRARARFGIPPSRPSSRENPRKPEKSP